MDGTAKLWGRDYEFQEPTLRREQTLRSEGLIGDPQGEADESQPAETRDDAEAMKISSVCVPIVVLGLSTSSSSRPHQP